MKGFEGQEVGVVNDGDDEFALGDEVAGFGDETGLAFVVIAIGFEVQGGAEEAQEVDSSGLLLYGRRLASIAKAESRKLIDV